ncbi:hypothetical protein B0H14DRAFT_3461823 [Mycena olivaceomarginata]|nr:hypothetical protein B0H14DRAFT_3461823 [Mycena olivaceomarginata]
MPLFTNHATMSIKHSPRPLPRGGPLTRGGGTPAHFLPPTYDLQTALPVPLLAPSHQNHLPYIALHAFLADWLHPALALCFDGLEIVYPLHILNAKTLLGSVPSSALNPLPVWQHRLPLPP